MSGGHGHDEGGHAEGHKEHDEEHEEHAGESHEEGGHEEHGADEHAGHGEHGHGGHEEHAPKPEKKKEPAPNKKKVISETDILMLLAMAIVGRLLTNSLSLTSIEPIIPIAVYAGLAYGSEAGILIGIFSYPLSNIFLEGGVFGVWTILQAMGGAISGGLAGSSKKADPNSLLYYSVIGTVIFELILNFPDGAFLIWPFSFTHIVSNFVFALLIATAFPKQK